jgi:hypothetical protein
MILIIQLLISLLYAVFSFGMADPNFLLIAWGPYVQFQQFMQSLMNDRSLLVSGYLILIIAFFGLYFWWLRIAATRDLQTIPGGKFLLSRLTPSWAWFSLIVVAALPLVFAYNALSHDLFNYLFNAKMVVVYGADPHSQVALDFATDDWTRFMHNTHTPAPYGYGWTALSLLPYLLGQGLFSLTWLLFKLFSLVSLVLTFVAVSFWSKAVYGKELTPVQVVLLFANPLVLIEVLANGHNDLWMLAPAIFGLALICKFVKEQGKNLVAAGGGFLLLGFSVLVKLATAMILPLGLLLLALPIAIKRFVSKRSWGKLLPQPLIGMFAERWFNLALVYVPTIASLLLFLPLLTARSQQFHPWYLLWPLVWLPFIQSRVWKVLLIVFSVSSMLRYLPWLQAGVFTDEVLLQQKMLTWMPAAIALFYLWQRRARA